MPFDMTVLNELDRFHLALEAIARVSGLAEKVAGVVVELHGKLDEHHRYVREHGEDMPEIQGWRGLALAGLIFSGAVCAGR